MHEEFILAYYPTSKGAKIITHTFIMKQIKSRRLGIHLLEILNKHMIICNSITAI